MYEFDVIEVEILAAEEARKREATAKRIRAWKDAHLARLSSDARERYRENHQRTCPGTEEDPYCAVDLSGMRSVRCDRHAHDQARAKDRARYLARKEQAEDE